MGLLDGLFKAGQALGGLIPGIGPLVSAGFGAAEGAYDSSITAQANRRLEDRQDSSVQRRVADLRAAGLAPQLAAGGGAPSSDPIRSDDTGGVSQGVDDAERIQSAKIAQATALISQKAALDKSNGEKALLDEKVKEAERKNLLDASFVYNEDGTPMLDAKGNQVPLMAYRATQDMEIRKRSSERYGAMVNVNEARAALLKAGLSEQEADSEMARIQARDMTSSERYYKPWLGGSLGGAFLDVGKGLVKTAGHALMH